MSCICPWGGGAFKCNTCLFPFINHSLYLYFHSFVFACDFFRETCFLIVYIHTGNFIKDDEIQSHIPARISV